MRKKLAACILLIASPSFGWDVGFDFRSTQAFVTDPAFAVFAAMGVTTSPTTATIGGQSVTYGWEALGSGSLTRDRTTGFDPRLAGINCQQNNGNTSVFRVDLPGTGDYNIGLALGDTGGYSQPSTVGVSSGGINVFSLFAVNGLTRAIDVADATGSVRLATDWPVSNLPVRITFPSTVFRIAIGGPPGAAYSCLAHLRITKATVRPPGAGGWAFFVL